MHLRSCVLRNAAGGAMLVAAASLAMPTAGQAAVFQFQRWVSPDSSYDHVSTNFDQVTNSPGGTQGGGENIMRVGLSDPSSSNPFRAAVSFPLTGLSVPAGEQVSSVTLTLHIRGDEDSPNGNDGVLGPFELHTVTGAGLIDETQVRWTHRNSTTPWATPGGDFDPTPVSSIPAFVATNTGTFEGAAYTFPSSPGFVAAINSAISAGAPLQFILRSSSEEAQIGNGEGMARWLSDDSPVATGRPLLTITTAPIPEPSALLGASLAVGALAMRRRRMA